MSIFCDRCRNEVHPLSSYCFYCGAAAPVRTVVGDFSEPAFEKGIFCPSCGNQAPPDGAFCGKCSESLFAKPEGAAVYCPTCGEKNNADASGCLSCRHLFADWYAMRGEAAQKLGHTGNLTIKEKMTGLTYHFINGDRNPEITIGRAPGNDVVIPCAFVSSAHCLVDTVNKKLTDSGSGNGTYINRSPEQIQTVSLFETDEFNVAGSFTFKVVRSDTFFIFRLMAILDEEECRKNGDPAAFEALRQQYYILFFGDSDVKIRRQDGYIDAEKRPHHDYYSVRIENGFYYYSDPQRDIEDRLMFNKTSNWPVNWVRENTIRN